MIHSLYVENIALIDKLNIEFSEGLNVLTGETGAGKSIIVDSMNLILGERADREMIRSGRDHARVEALIFIDQEKLTPVFTQYGLDTEEELIVSRDISLEGKNICRINGQIVNLSTLKGIMNHVVDLHGQHEHQGLLYAENHLQLIDSFGGKNIEGVISSTNKAVDELKQIESQLSALGGDLRDREQNIDLLEFQINELNEANIEQNEIDRLVEQRDLLRNAQSIAEALNKSYQMLYEGSDGGQTILSLLKNTWDSLSSISTFGEEYELLANQLEERYYQLEETAFDIEHCIDTVVFDSEKQNEIEERIDFIHTLFRKYNVKNENELLGLYADIEQRYEALLHSEEKYKVLTKRIQDKKEKLYNQFVDLSEIRRREAKELERLILKELNDLGIENAQFEVRFQATPSLETAVFSEGGFDAVEFFISTNLGEPLKPLSKTASGGEISRIMLAFKNITAAVDQVSTMIFDEIDTGISGKMAHIVAEKLASISKRRQVICVTHLPQIAAMGDRSFLITKRSSTKVTNTYIHQLDEEEFLHEIGRLSGGIDTKSAIEYAKELISNAKEVKKNI